MNETTLNFLTRDGMVSVTFSPALTPEQYSELYHRIPLADSADEMRDLLISLQSHWGVQALVETS